MQQSRQRVIISGSSHPTLARAIAQQSAIALAKVETKRFRDGERYVRLQVPLRGREVFIVQSGYDSAQEHTAELLMLIDAARREHPKRITAVFPFVPYRRSERRSHPGEAVGIAVLARTLEVLGVRRTICVDLHEPTSARYFRYPVLNLLPFEEYTSAVKRLRLVAPVVTGADGGASHHARSLAKLLNIPATSFTKRRSGHDRVGSVALRTKLVGKDVILIDDEISTGGTIIACAKKLKRDRVRSITVLVAHAVLAGDASRKLQASAIDRVIATDTIPVPRVKRFPKLQVLSIAPTIARALNT